MGTVVVPQSCPNYEEACANYRCRDCMSASISMSMYAKQLLRSGPKLKNDVTKIWLEEDFLPKTQLARKKLRNFAKGNCKDKKSFMIRYNKLYLHGRTYKSDSVSKQIVLLNEQVERPTA